MIPNKHCYENNVYINVYSSGTHLSKLSLKLIQKVITKTSLITFQNKKNVQQTWELTFGQLLHKVRIIGAHYFSGHFIHQCLCLLMDNAQSMLTCIVLYNGGLKTAKTRIPHKHASIQYMTLFCETWSIDMNMLGIHLHEMLVSLSNLLRVCDKRHQF